VKKPADHADEKPIPFRFRDGETLRHCIRRIAQHELERIREGLDEGAGTEESIHEIRKGTTRLRALLRLVRDTVGKKQYRRENRAFRDIGRAFAGARDAEVAEKSLADVGCRRVRERPRQDSAGRNRAPSAIGWASTGRRGGAKRAKRAPCPLVARRRGRSSWVAAKNVINAACAGSKPECGGDDEG